MEQKSIREQEQSRYGFDYWEGWVRGKIRYWVTAVRSIFPGIAESLM